MICNSFIALSLIKNQKIIEVSVRIIARYSKNYRIQYSILHLNHSFPSRLTNCSIQLNLFEEKRLKVIKVNLSITL